ncbi:hypothetical protein CRYUN_Cryun28dG0041700 [Craigia yunnanensis]
MDESTLQLISGIGTKLGQLARPNKDVLVKSLCELANADEVLIGQWIKVWSTLDSCFYLGTVDDFNPENNTHMISCDSGEIEILCLESESWETISDCSLTERDATSLGTKETSGLVFVCTLFKINSEGVLLKNLNVEPAPGVDLEGLDVARECLTEVFKLDSACINDVKPDVLVDMFSSLEASEDQKIKSDLSHWENSDNTSGSSSFHDVRSANSLEASKLGDNWTREPQSAGASKDELFGQFFAALEKIHFFRAMPDGNDDPAQLDKATHLFQEALNEMERSGCQAFDRKNLAETFKCQGNRAMQSKLYSDAIELYSVAVSLCDDNAVYYCNRAAAYTQIHKYNEAIRDCLKSIEIDPNYSKAYSRLGLAYYAQGNYADAIEKGFKKALQLDPNNESVKENIRVAEQKLKDEHQRAEWDQSASSSHNNQGSNNHSTGSRSHGASPPFTMPFDTSTLPGDFASMLMNMAASAYQGQPSQNRQGEDINTNGSEEPGIRIGGNINLNFGDQMQMQMQIPEELTGAVRSVMDMFSGSGTSPHGNTQGTNPHGNTQDTNGRSASN